MKTSITRAMILCAGLGTRLMPITDKFAKPLVPILNVPNVFHNIHRLRAAGITEIIFNLHYLGDSIAAALGDGKKWGMRFAYSRETTLLGTGGGVKRAESFFKGETFIVCNCDFVTNIDLNPMVERHLQKKAVATMVMIEDPERQPFFSKVGLGADDALCSLGKLITGPSRRSGIFTGIQILSPPALAFLKDEPSDVITTLYYPLMKQQPKAVLGHFAENAYWYDTGDLRGIWQTSMTLLQELETNPNGIVGSCLKDFGGYQQNTPGLWTNHSSAKLPVAAKLKGPVVMGKDCQISEQAEIGPYSVIGDEVAVGAGLKFSYSLALPQATVSESHTKVQTAVCFNSQSFAIPQK